jgi:hypothetical protein
MELQKKHEDARKSNDNKVGVSILNEANPSVSTYIIENQKNGKKYLVESVSTEEVLRRRNSAYKFLM